MYIKMVGDTTKYHGNLERLGLHMIKVSGLIKHNSGFRLYLDNDVLVGDYSNFIYSYDDPTLGEGIYVYTDNNLQYEPDETLPTKEEQERQKIESVITKFIGDDVTALSQQISTISETLIPMYEVMLQIQEALMGGQEEETPSVEETAEDEDNNDNTPSEPVKITKKTRKKA